MCSGAQKRAGRPLARVRKQQYTGRRNQQSPGRPGGWLRIGCHVATCALTHKRPTAPQSATSSLSYRHSARFMSVTAQGARRTAACGCVRAGLLCTRRTAVCAPDCCVRVGLLCARTIPLDGESGRVKHPFFRGCCARRWQTPQATRRCRRGKKEEENEKG